MPWIAKPNPTSATRQSVPKLVSSVYSTPGRRLWLRVRRRLRTLGILRLYSTMPVQPKDCWSLLVALSQGGKQAFDMETYLRSEQVSTLHIYGLLRMCNLLDDPPRTAVKAALKRVLGFRKAPAPRPAGPLCLPPLAHPGFKKSVQSWITQLTKKYALFFDSLSSSLQIPSCRVSSLFQVSCIREKTLQPLDHGLGIPHLRASAQSGRPSTQTWSVQMVMLQVPPIIDFFMITWFSGALC